MAELKLRSSDDEVEAGIRCAREHQELVDAFSERMRELGEMMVRAGEELSKGLGHVPDEPEQE